MEGLMNAVRNNDVEAIAREIVSGGVDLTMYDFYNGTPLHYAVTEKCNRNTVQFLNIQFNAANHYGDTPLHCALQDNNIDMARFLLLLNANVYVTNYVGKSPLDMAKADKNMYAIMIPHTNGHRLWVKWRPLIIAIGRISLLYRESVHNVWKPGGVGYNACKRDFEQLSFK